MVIAIGTTRTIRPGKCLSPVQHLFGIEITWIPLIDPAPPQREFVPRPFTNTIGFE
jgi:hypothetical protein